MARLYYGPTWAKPFAELDAYERAGAWNAARSNANHQRRAQAKREAGKHPADGRPLSLAQSHHGGHFEVTFRAGFAVLVTWKPTPRSKPRLIARWTDYDDAARFFERAARDIRNADYRDRLAAAGRPDPDSVTGIAE